MEEVGPEFVRNQEVLGELKTWILAQSETAESGYIDQVNDAATFSVRFLWHGEDPFLDDVIEYAQGLGINTSVEYRSMSLSEIHAAIERVWAARDDLAEQGLKVDSIGGVGIEDNGLEVMVVYSGPLAASPEGVVSKEVQAARDEMKAVVEGIAGTDVMMVEGEVFSTLDAL